ncbi:UPF0481 protein [Salvia divinorum]|uniref:UPF0481 protein n=1 Tax=Salvia divinorum TaxID=28513 RepID=A0ABD1H525_SALDI
MEVKEWMVSVNEQLGNLPHTSEESAQLSKRSIHRIPTSVTAINSTAYSPYIVSIGPYHHGSDNTKPMENHKRRALLIFLKRSNKPLHAFWDALAPFAQDLKDAYDELSPEWHDTDKFLQLMIIDGCFILEILRATNISTFSDIRDYAANDPVFSSHGDLYVVPYLKRDVLMLENQLPMLVLLKLVDVQKDQFLNEDLTRRILKFFHQYTPAKYIHVFSHSPHILDGNRGKTGTDPLFPTSDSHQQGSVPHIYRKCLLLKEPRRHKVKPGGGHIGDDEFSIIRSATELVAGGITIKMSESRSLTDISFNYVDRVLKLPQIVVDESMESVYLNQMAFERFHIGRSSDMSILQRCGVIQSAVGSEEDEVVKLFQLLSKDVTLDPESSLDEVHRQVSAYCRKPWSQWRAEIARTYFTDPWAITAAAVLLFVLTTVQTIFSVLAYVNPP